MIDAFVIESAAITIVFVKGSIFQPLRESGPKLWQTLAGCPLCAGVWIGAGWLLLRRLLASQTFGLATAADALAAGAVTGVLALLLALVWALFDKHS